MQTYASLLKTIASIPQFSVRSDGCKIQWQPILETITPLNWNKDEAEWIQQICLIDYLGFSEDEVNHHFQKTKQSEEAWSVKSHKKKNGGRHKEHLHLQN